MATDLLSTIRGEIDERLKELRPLLAEYERLRVTANALGRNGGRGGAGSGAARAPVAAHDATPTRRARRVGVVSTPSAKSRSALARPKTARSDLAQSDLVQSTPAPVKPARVKPAPATPARAKPARAVRGAAREAILGALEHGSHTVGELAVVTAMSGASINGNLRRLATDGMIVKTEREGKTAWSLPSASI
jgi:hypothetical protein